MAQAEKGNTDGETATEGAKWRETQWVFPQINTTGKRRSVPLILHHDKVLHKFI